MGEVRGRVEEKKDEGRTTDMIFCLLRPTASSEAMTQAVERNRLETRYSIVSLFERTCGSPRQVESKDVENDHGRDRLVGHLGSNGGVDSSESSTNEKNDHHEGAGPEEKGATPETIDCDGGIDDRRQVGYWRNGFERLTDEE